MGRKLSVHAIIVTYGDRAKFVKRTVKRIQSFPEVSRVIIVDNNSVAPSQRQLDRIARDSRGKILLLRNNSNEGPGRAIRTALESASTRDRNSFFWILDDDNLPANDALSVLIHEWNSYVFADKEENLIAVSFRKDRPNYIRAVQERRPEEIMGRPNIFRSFHIRNLFRLIMRKLIVAKKTNERPVIDTVGEIPVAPYGGMFFHRELIRKYGYPDGEYYLYFDDYEFSRRIIRNGGRIILTCGSIIEDQEQSWYNRGFGFMRLAMQKNRVVLYYSVRNRILFEREYLVSRMSVYLLNAAVYCGIMFTAMLMTFNFRNAKVFAEAVHDGFTGKKGIREKYLLK